MPLREAFSNQNSAFVKLMRLEQDDLSDDRMPLLLQVNEVDPRRYRSNRKLTPAERAKLAEEYRFGVSALELARKYKTHRHTIAAHLKREGIAVRGQLKMTSELVNRAKTLYAEGQTPVTIGKQLGVEASTVGKALKRAGVRLRPPVASRWHPSPLE